MSHGPLEPRCAPSPTTLIFIRHAEAADRDARGALRLCGQVDIPLTERGQRQAERLRLALAGLGPVGALYTSPLRRAVQTARPIAQALGLSPRAWRSLREIACGVLDGAPVADVRRQYPQLWQANLAQADDTFAWPGGETYGAFRRRVIGAVRRIARRHPGGQVVVVTHAGVISQVLGSLVGAPAARWELFRPAPASLTVVAWLAKDSRIVRFDDRRHLAGRGSH